MTTGRQNSYPRIAPVGLDGCIVSFGATLDERANRAALSFRAALDEARLEGVEETSTSLTSAFLRFDALATRAEALEEKLAELLASRDWYRAPLPPGRRLWRVPCVFGGALGPQLGEAAEAAGLGEAEAIDSLQAARLRVLTIGFAPGQPYLGQLPETWNIPRQRALSPRVPAGALVVAIRQLIVFSNATPTGWRHVGQTAWENFRLARDPAFVLRPGDEMQFEAVTPQALEAIRARNEDGLGGAQSEVIE